jgi:hypothetical protein
MCSSVNLIEIKTSIYCDEALSEQTVLDAVGTHSTQNLILIHITLTFKGM